MTGRTKGTAAIVASAFGFALMGALVRLSDDLGGALSVFQKGFFRNAVAFVIAACVFARSWRSEPSHDGLSAVRTPRTFAKLTLRCLFGSAGLFANFYALGHVPIAVAQTLNKTAPFFTVLFAWIFLGERVGLKRLATLVTAFAGVLLVVKPGFAGADAPALAWGLFGGFAAGSAYACLHSLRTDGVNSAFIVLTFSAFSCLVSIPLMAHDFAPMNLLQTLILLGAGIAAALGQFGITLAYGYAAPRDIAVYDYTSVLFAGLFGLAFFGQTPDWLSAIGFAVIVLAAARMYATAK